MNHVIKKFLCSLFGLIFWGGLIFNLYYIWNHAIIVPRLFEEKWRDTVFGFPWGVVRGAWRVARGAWCVARGAWCVVRGSEFLVGTLSP